MKAYRLVHRRHSDGLSPEGARRYGGRWNSKGIPALYCATSESLALLELRVHAPHPYPRTRLKFVFEVPDDAIATTELDKLPKGWDNIPLGPESKRFGDAWLESNSSLGLLVPSVTAIDEFNLVLNPGHPRFADVRILSKSLITLDRRLYGAAKTRKAARKK